MTSDVTRDSTRDDGVYITVNTELYSEEAVFRTCYLFTDRCYLWLDWAAPSQLQVRFRSRHAEQDVDAIVKYMAEVREGETVATYSRFFGRNEKRIHCMHVMINESQQSIAAILEGVVLHVDRQTKRSVAFPGEVAAIIDSWIARDKALEWEAPHSQPLGI